MPDVRRSLAKLQFHVNESLSWEQIKGTTIFGPKGMYNGDILIVLEIEEIES
jgi:hypothetical protein